MEIIALINITKNKDTNILIIKFIGKRMLLMPPDAPGMPESIAYKAAGPITVIFILMPC